MRKLFNYRKETYMASKEILKQKEAIVNENNDVLKHIKELIKEGKLDKDE